MYTSLFPYWFVQYDNFQALNTKEFLAGVGSLESWLQKQQARPSKQGNQNTVAKGEDVKKVQSALTKAIHRLQDFEDELEEIGKLEKKRKAESQAIKADEKDKMVLEKPALKEEEKKMIAEEMELVYEFLTKTDVGSDLEKAEKILHAGHSTDSISHWITIIIEPEMKNVILYEPIEKLWRSKP